MSDSNLDSNSSTNQQTRNSADSKTSNVKSSAPSARSSTGDSLNSGNAQKPASNSPASNNNTAASGRRTDYVYTKEQLRREIAMITQNKLQLEAEVED
ncbi:MAG: hypothetical protein MHMPM18_001929, partial [Marteilia pararefringens]